jgi:hypothetical protein
MLNISWAEWIIARFTDRTRAASIVGDLLEGATEQETSRFWWSVAGIVLSLTWRRPIAFVAALFMGLYSLGALPTAIYSLYATHRPPGEWVPFFAVLSGLGVLLWMTAPYAAIRYGFRDGFAQLALALCGLITIVIFCWWIKALDITCVALALLVFVTSVVSPQRRRALLALVASLAFGFAGVLLASYLPMLMYPRPVAEMRPGAVSCLWLLEVAILTTACSHMHRLLLRREQMDSETESAE